MWLKNGTFKSVWFFIFCSVGVFLFIWLCRLGVIRVTQPILFIVGWTTILACKVNANKFTCEPFLSLLSHSRVCCLLCAIMRALRIRLLFLSLRVCFFAQIYLTNMQCDGTAASNYLEWNLLVLLVVSTRLQPRLCVRDNKLGINGRMEKISQKCCQLHGNCVVGRDSRSLRLMCSWNEMNWLHTNTLNTWQLNG